MLTRRWLRTLAALVLAGLALASAGSAQALGDTVTPDLGPPGTAYSFTAVGFGANEIVRVTFQAPDGSRTRFADNRGQDVSLVAAVGGTVRWVYTTASNAADGIYVAEAANISGQIRRRIGFIVQAGATPTDLLPPQPGDNVSVNPPLGPPGTLFAFRTSGFQPIERVAIWLHAPDGSVSDLTTDTGGRVEYFADRSGGLEWIVRTGAGTPDGRYIAVAAGVNSRVTRIAAFEVRQGAVQAAPLPTTNATVSPAVGPPGTSFAFNASGFLPLEGIGIWIHRPDGQIITVTADGSDVKANQIGIASWSVPANSSLADGVYTMVAEGVTSTQVRVVRFQVQR